MAEFIAKKREIFLVQLSLDNKRAEIRKLEEGSFQREEVGFEVLLEIVKGEILDSQCIRLMIIIYCP
jgi:hypothetical protein